MALNLETHDSQSAPSGDARSVFRLPAFSSGLSAAVSRAPAPVGQNTEADEHRPGRGSFLQVWRRALGILKSLGDGHGYLKAGFLGFQKSGKTFTAIELALGTRQMFGLTAPLAMFDTEGGSTYIADKVKQATGQELLGVRSRSLKDLLETVRECEGGAASVLLVDSVTHVWREVMESYQRQTRRNELSFRDWAPIKAKWAEWTDLYLGSKLHIIICGRAGWEYSFEEDDRGKRELIKTGTKLKAESEFGFEPSLLVEMERVPGEDKRQAILHRATVLGDRFGVIDGAQTDNPSFDFFLPHLQRLTPGAYAGIDMENKTEFDVQSDDWPKEREARKILSEEIQGEILRAWPGQTAAEKAKKADVLERLFGTRSWTKISEHTKSAELRAGLEKLRVELSP